MHDGSELQNSISLCLVLGVGFSLRARSVIYSFSFHLCLVHSPGAHGFADHLGFSVIVDLFCHMIFCELNRPAFLVCPNFIFCSVAGQASAVFSMLMTTKLKALWIGVFWFIMFGCEIFKDISWLDAEFWN